jgi:subtilisin family serine protease
LIILLTGSRANPTTVQAGPFVQQELLTAFDREPTTDVLITLREAAGLTILSPASAASQRIVAFQKERVLAGVATSEFTATREYQSLPILAGKLSSSGLAKLRTHPDIASVTVDGVGTIATGTSVPLIHAPDVHASGLTGEGVVVAILDTGADRDHPDLADDIIFDACYATDCDETNSPGDDEHGHGTNVTGTITSAGTVAPLGVAPDAQIAVYRVISRSGSGRISDWIAALDDIIANHPEVNIINMSLQSDRVCPDSALSLAISTLRDMGVATFIASGNYGIKDQIRVPACVLEAISVGATYDDNIGGISGWENDCRDETTSADQVACWSSSDDTLDLVAPGANSTSTGRGGNASTFRGTSFSSPLAAGVAALLYQAFPDITVDELEARMKATGTLVTDDLADNDPSTNRTTPRIDARVALLNLDEDTDGDGCTDGEELGNDPRFGGQRNPLNPWDFHDVNGDGVVSLLDDILPVISGFGVAGNDPGLDRSPAPPGAQPWLQGPPDGTIDISNDILGVASQFGHTCAGAP